MKPEYPRVAFDVFDRVVDQYSLGGYAKQANGVKDGMIVVCTKPQGDTYLHTDPMADRVGGLAAVTFNVLVQAPESGGELFLGDPLQLIDIEERELHCYAASAHQHKVTPVEGDRCRYMWIFRVAMPLTDWEQ